MFGKWFRRILIALLGLIIIGAGAIFIILQFFVSVNNPFTQGSGNLNQISLPDGFEIEIFAENIDGARSMRLGENGTLFISSRAPGNLYAIPDATNGGREVITFASGLTSPNGIAIVDDDLYVAEISRISRYDDIENTLDSPQSVVIQDNLRKSVV